MGTSGVRYFLELDDEDHPHAYGDKVARTGVIPEHAGSSPRVWGQVFLFLARQHATRIIPTRMGTRVIIMLRILIYRDHPHAYGDKCGCL